jgi:hypothetical protein
MRHLWRKFVVKHKEIKMTSRKFLWGIPTLALVFGFVIAGCVTYRPVDVTNTMAAQIASIKIHEIQPGEEVKTLYVDRTGSFVADLNRYESGTWYRAHQDKVVNVEAVVQTVNYGFTITRKNQWRIEYVE